MRSRARAEPHRPATGPPVRGRARACVPARGVPSMADLRVDISAHAGGWRFQWHEDGTPTGSPLDVPGHAADQLGYLGSAIAGAFEHRSAGGFARLPFVLTAALDHTGVQLRDLCCGPITTRLADEAGSYRLMVA